MVRARSQLECNGHQRQTSMARTHVPVPSGAVSRLLCPLYSVLATNAGGTRLGHDVPGTLGKSCCARSRGSSTWPRRSKQTNPGQAIPVIRSCPSCDRVRMPWSYDLYRLKWWKLSLIFKFSASVGPTASPLPLVLAQCYSTCISTYLELQRSHVSSIGHLGEGKAQLLKYLLHSVLLDAR
jgi:hypothetical protein